MFMARMGRPPNEVQTVLLACRVVRPVARKIRAMAKARGMRLGTLVQEVLERAIRLESAK